MTSWTATVAWTQAHVTDRELDELLDKLAGYSPAIGLEQRETGKLLEVTITLESSTLRRATTEALRLVEDAASGKATDVEILATAEHDRRTEQPTIPPLVGFAEIAEMAGVSRQRAWQLADLTGFPPAVVETQSGPPRVRTQVEGWLSRWERKAGRPKRDTTTGADLGG